ncbi:hypothetical protein PQU95_13345 [Vogesella sp. DC21W]|uniref:Uncharacterized protein n=1 Tax=Vogesella aquatica TaxID=2984206 RepID=A0ABT5J055_9NEIS|nr:hypothetical protein [Vogesella aquatica]MDC7718199.1 hypothetical protein [Vogesella aquatica]
MALFLAAVPAREVFQCQAQDDALGGSRRKPDNAAVASLAGLPFGALLCQTVLAGVALLRPVLRALPPPAKCRSSKNSVNKP